MKEITKNDIISLAFGLFCRYSDIVLASKEKNENNRFFVKQLTSDGVFTGIYCNTCDAIFKEKEMIPYTSKFNPEKLI